MREPLSWSKKVRLRRWARRQFHREHHELLRTAGAPGERSAFTRHAARATALIRIFDVTGPARDEVAALVLERPIDASCWDAALLGMRAEVEAKLRALGLPLPPASRTRAAAERT
jgi:hypothetical protein